MERSISIIISGLLLSVAWAELDCTADSSYHIDTRTMLPDGSPNPTYGQETTDELSDDIKKPDYLEDPI